MIKITIFTDNAAFDVRPECEIARILGDLASTFRNERMLEPGVQFPLIDINGQRVGECEAE